MATRNLLSAIVAVLALPCLGAPLPAGPDEIYGELFVAVQRAQIFEDQKTFVDCVPRQAPNKILEDYERERTKPGFQLKAFVEDKFLVPEPIAAARVKTGLSIEEHLDALWTQLRRAPDTAVPGSSLVPLPHPYIVPGGRFREIYYWDSYFTMLGLRESGEEELIESMIENFAHLIERFDHIPNGNRTYFVSRSQPPYFSLMVQLLAEKKGDDVYERYLPSLQREYEYWMDRRAPTRHVIRLENGVVLNRYDDLLPRPRPESYRQDVEVAGKSSQPEETLFRHLRAACESGWDFSSRWFADGQNLETIRTQDIVPVDLNCLLHHLESTLAMGYEKAGDAEKAREFSAVAERRKDAIQTLFWSRESGYFHDYDSVAGTVTAELTLAGVTPLYFGLATPEQAAAAAKVIETRFLRPGGVVTTLKVTGQQWDAPNGWAPLQWLTVKGLENYGESQLARTIATRWLALNRAVYERTGKMMEKYNVEDTSLEAGGGEYPSQDGFGWSNGVYLKLARMYEN